MATPDELETELTQSEALRDKIFEYLPSQARKSLLGVEVKFWPSDHGEMELKLYYDPTDNLLDIDAIEGVYGGSRGGSDPQARITGYIVKGCELDSETGEVHAYSEGSLDANKFAAPTHKALLDAEKDVWTFTPTAEQFLLGLFDSI